VNALVLDVKFGKGAVMVDEAKARELAEKMVRDEEKMSLLLSLSIFRYIE
jgi:thymidine phosphorylase